MKISRQNFVLDQVIKPYFHSSPINLNSLKTNIESEQIFDLIDATEQYNLLSNQ